MRRRLLWVVVGAPLALFFTGAGAALSLPTVRHVLSGLWNLPDRLPALPDHPRVHHEAGAADFAREVAALLPAAIEQVEAIHGRAFAHPVTIGAYRTPDAFAAANGMGSTVPVGATFFGRVNLSPKLFGPEHGRLRAILTHELSHAHIAGWIGGGAYQLPNWFKEGLAVMASGGGGAELVGEAEAWAAIRRGEQIVVDADGALDSPTGIRFAKQPVTTADPVYPIVLAYREAGMFVDYLRTSDKPAFDRLTTAVLDGKALPEAIAAGYSGDVHALWQKFLKANADPT